MDKRFWFVWSLILMFSFSFASNALGKVLFRDDFESDAEGKEPSKWSLAAGNNKGTVVKDPNNAKNKALSVAEHFNWGGPQAIVGELSWTDYVAEWDWMFQKDTHHAMMYFWNDQEHFYHFSRREGNIAWQNYARENNWIFLKGVDYPTKLMEWYRVQLTVDSKGGYSAKVKPKSDDTPFEKLDPILVGQDVRYKKGKFGTNGALTSYIDDLLIYEIGTPISELLMAVKGIGKLPITWGEMKSR
jgi:hypothetical protein